MRHFPLSQIFANESFYYLDKYWYRKCPTQQGWFKWNLIFTLKEFDINSTEHIVKIEILHNFCTIAN